MAELGRLADASIRRAADIAAKARSARQGRKEGDWGVIAINEKTGERQTRRTGLTAADAEQIAGHMRDHAPDSEIAAGWNHLARKLPRNQARDPGTATAAHRGRAEQGGDLCPSQRAGKRGTPARGGR
jgi:hypothetical protein